MPADIRYPTDHSLLNEAREKTEKMVDTLHKPFRGKKKKPRTGRRKARKEYLYYSKKRKLPGKELKRAIRKQLGYVKKNLEFIAQLCNQEGAGQLSKKELKDLKTIIPLFSQQQKMYETGKHSVENRIVSISQPHVRPIVRGKAGAKTEFGAKISISVVDGYTFLDRFSWNNYNESEDLIEQIEKYYTRFGYYPESVHVDQIYRNRKNREYCKEKGIRMSGPPLGRPKKNKDELQADKKLQQEDEGIRNAVEGRFGVGKRRYGLNRIYEKLPETSESTTHLIFFIMNLDTLMKEVSFCLMWMLLIKALLHEERQVNRVISISGFNYL